MKGGWQIIVQDLANVNSALRNKTEKNLKQQQQQQRSVGIFQETEDPIKVTEVRGGCVQVDVGDHDNLMGLYAQSLGE